MGLLDGPSDSSHHMDGCKEFGRRWVIREGVGSLVGDGKGGRDQRVGMEVTDRLKIRKRFEDDSTVE